ncbi:class I SAM-dependent methyltransferase [Pannonibacter phragmitetus]|uniref:class I SAM-dependent methyltransferase n=1 Tax=Pannonibacter phragmitetus TaxID=121719 RepID=UPI003D2EC511
MTRTPDPFMDPAAVASYLCDTPRKVPGLADLHKMTALLIAEKAPRAAHVLVVGAGGGLEIRALAQAQPDWLFTGVDPSPAMLDIARQTLSDCAERADLIQGTAVDAPKALLTGPCAF